MWTTPVDSSAWRSTRTYASAVGSSVDVALGDREQSPAATVVIGDHRLIGAGRFFVYVRDEGPGYRFYLQREVTFQRSPRATKERARSARETEISTQTSRRLVAGGVSQRKKTKGILRGLIIVLCSGVASPKIFGRSKCLSSGEWHYFV